MVDVPDYLRPHTGRFDYSPPVESRPRLLPFGEIPWEDFEALSLELFEQQHELVDARLYAGRGQGQDGIDLYGVTPEQEYETAQCRRVRSLTPGAVVGMVDDFFDGAWAERSSSLTLFTAASTESDTVAAAIETQRQRLADAGVQSFAVRDRPLAYMQIPDLDAAEASLRRAEESAAAKDFLQLGLVRANLVVQRSRLAVGRQRPTDAHVIEQAEADCLRIREALIAEHRFGESVRASMLAVDANRLAIRLLASRDAARDGNGATNRRSGRQRRPGRFGASLRGPTTCAALH
jgi:hypothetical protein